jgi:hypothetical protein
LPGQLHLLMTDEFVGPKKFRRRHVCGDPSVSSP